MGTAAGNCRVEIYIHLLDLTRNRSEKCNFRSRVLCLTNVPRSHFWPVVPLVYLTLYTIEEITFRVISSLVCYDILHLMIVKAEGSNAQLVFLLHWDRLAIQGCAETQLPAMCLGIVRIGRSRETDLGGGLSRVALMSYHLVFWRALQIGRLAI